MDSLFAVAVLIVAALAGGVASLAGFGIGSLLTPLLALQMDTRVAVAAVAIPHFLATLLRFWFVHRALDRQVLLGFGLASAAGGLTGAILHGFAGNPVLTVVFGCLLIFAGGTGITGLADRLRFSGVAGWIAGAVSGFFGGLVGNQGGIRSAALLGFHVPRDAFVATATAVALLVDIARVPVYLVTAASELQRWWPLIGIAAIGVLIGTVLGTRILGRIPEKIFRKGVFGLILLLGIFMLVQLAV